MMPLCALPLLPHGREQMRDSNGLSILTLGPASQQKGQIPPLKSTAHHNTRICIVQENVYIRH